MPNKTIWVSQQDIEAAHRIARQMFPGRVMSDESVLSAALLEGMQVMKVAWEEEPPKLQVIKGE